MLLNEYQLDLFNNEIVKIYEENFLVDFKDSNIHFGITQDETLQAIGSLSFNLNMWFLCCGYVKPEHRGHGLQQRLIYERLAYVSNVSDTARVLVYPENTYSLHNIIQTGFSFEDEITFKSDNKTGHIYKKMLR